MDAQPREAEGTALGQSGGDAEATDGRGRWRFTSACSGGFYRAGLDGALLKPLAVQSHHVSIEPYVADIELLPNEWAVGATP